MSWSDWNIALVVCKLFIYSGACAAVGGPVTLWLSHQRAALLPAVRSYQFWLIFISMIASVAAFFIQVGAVAEEGIGGMLHPLFLSIVWNSSLGDAVFWRMLALVLILLTLVLLSVRALHSSHFGFAAVSALYGCALLMLLLSFGLVGHTVASGIRAQSVLALHLLVMGSWIGSLWPLWMACHTLDQSDLHTLMVRFGKAAAGFVGLLIASGFYLALQLFPQMSDIFSTSYGRVFLTKLLLVSAILLLALWHKLRLVPNLLSHSENRWLLSRSIQTEMILAMAILMTTAVLTTFVGPEHGE